MFYPSSGHTPPGEVPSALPGLEGPHPGIGQWFYASTCRLVGAKRFASVEPLLWPWCGIYLIARSSEGQGLIGLLSSGRGACLLAGERAWLLLFRALGEVGDGLVVARGRGWTLRGVTVKGSLAWRALALAREALLGVRPAWCPGRLGFLERVEMLAWLVYRLAGGWRGLVPQRLVVEEAALRGMPPGSAYRTLWLMRRKGALRWARRGIGVLVGPRPGEELVLSGISRFEPILLPGALRALAAGRLLGGEPLG